jgi:hypothetical protein
MMNSHAVSQEQLNAPSPRGHVGEEFPDLQGEATRAAFDTQGCTVRPLLV